MGHKFNMKVSGRNANKETQLVSIFTCSLSIFLKKKKGSCSEGIQFFLGQKSDIYPMGLYKIPYSVINKVLTHTAMSFTGQFLIVPLNLKKGNTKIKLS